MSDNILDNVLFNESFEEYENELYKKEKDNRTSYLANDYRYSNLRYWLNSTKEDGKYMYEDKNGYNYTANGFYDTAFSENEKNAINATTKTESVLDGVKESALINDKVFVLSSAQLDNPLYGFLTGNNYIDNNNSRRLDYTEYVKVNGRYTTNPIWQLRSTVTEQSRKVQYISEGNIIDKEIEPSYSGVAPAINLNINDIAFVTEAGFDKSEKFATTYSGNTIQEWNIAIQNSTEFEASLDEESLGMTKAGGRLSISINKLPTNASEYNQISAMLVDNNGTVVAYGKISDNVKLGTIDVYIPEDVEDGNYSLMIFAQDVNSSEINYATDFVTNMSAINVVVNTNNASVLDNLRYEKEQEHELKVVAYDTDEYAEGGEGVEFTSEGATIRDWNHVDSKYLQIDIKLHTEVKNDHAVKVRLPKELYFVGDLNKLPAGCEDVKFEANEDMLVNGDASKYNVKDKSGTLTYFISEGVRAVSIQLEVRYDSKLWNKQKNSALTEENVNPIEVSINYEPNKNVHLEGGELKTVSISKAYAGNSIDRRGKFVYETNNVDLKKGITRRLKISIVESNQTVDFSYNKETIFELHIPYWTDTKGIKHYLKYYIHPDEGIIPSAFYDNKVDFDIIEQSKSVIKVRVKNCMYRTNIEMLYIRFTYPGDIVTKEKLLTFGNGRFVINAIGNNGNSYTQMDSRIQDMEFPTRYIEGLEISPSDRTAYYNQSSKKLSAFGGMYLENMGIVNSSSKSFLIKFPEELLITTMNLPLDQVTQYIYVTYKLRDENSEPVYLDSQGKRVNSNATGAINSWKFKINNRYYGRAYGDISIDNLYYKFYRGELPESHRKYYFSEISYTIGTVQSGAKLYHFSEKRSHKGAGNYYGYYSKKAQMGGDYVTRVTVKSPQGSGIDDVNCNIITYARNDYSVPYGLQNVKFSKESITAGESVYVNGEVFISEYPYGSSMNMGGVRIALVLNKGVSVDKGDIGLTLSSGAKVNVENVTNRDIGNNEMLWIIQADPNVFIGYASEQLGELSNGSLLKFKVKLNTSKRMHTMSLFTDSMAFCAGKGVTNASVDICAWASEIDKWDINENNSTLDRIGRCSYAKVKSCNIVPNPPSMDITELLSIKGKGTMKNGIANIEHENDVVTYSLNLHSMEDGTASEFRYFIPIPKLTTPRDGYFMVSSKDSSFDMKLLGKASMKGDNIYKIEYCFDKNISFNDAQKLTEDRWYSVKNDKFYDCFDKECEGLKWSDVTIVRLTAEGDFEKGIDSTINLELAYMGNNISKDNYMKNAWRSSGYYIFNTSERVFSKYYRSPGVAAQIDSTWNYSERLTYVAKGNNNPFSANVVSNSFPGIWNKKEINSKFQGQQTIKITDIALDNVELKSKQFMINNQNTLTSAEANKYVAFELVLNNGESVDLSNGVDQVVGSFNGNEKPKFDLHMYYGSNYSDVGMSRSVTLTLESDQGMTFTIIADIYFVADNNIKVINGEDSYIRGSNLLTKVFYTYVMENNICAKEDIKFVIENTNNMVDIQFSLSTSKSPTVLDYYKYLVPKKYVTIRDENGAVVSSDSQGIYTLQGNVEYTLSLDDEYLDTLGDELLSGILGYDFINIGGSDSQFLYLHAVIPNNTSTQEVLIIKRRLLTLN